MIRYIARRLLLALPTLAGIVVLVFVLLHLAPGSPMSALGSETGRRVSQKAAEEMRRVYGLDRPLPERFGRWIGRVAKLDFGESFVDRRPIMGNGVAGRARQQPSPHPWMPWPDSFVIGVE